VARLAIIRSVLRETPARRLLFEFFVVRLGFDKQQTGAAFDQACARNIEVWSPGILPLWRQPPKA
jgi:hypothetical protein